MERRNLQRHTQGEPNPIERSGGFGKRELVKIWWSLLEHLYLEPSWLWMDFKAQMKEKSWEKYEYWLIKTKGEDRTDVAFKEWKEYVRELEKNGKIENIYDPEYIHEAMLPGIYPVIYFRIPTYEEEQKGEKNAIVIVEDFEPAPLHKEQKHFRIHIPHDLENDYWWDLAWAIDGCSRRLAFLAVFPDGHDFRSLFVPIEDNIRVYLNRNNEYLLAPYMDSVVNFVLFDARHLAKQICADLMENEG
jgi:hypothetical protein